MEKRRYYVDSCIWLNLFKKEGDASRGKPYWEIAEEFVEWVIHSADSEIIYSGIVLKEIKFKLPSELDSNEKEAYLKREFTPVRVTEEDKAFARKLEAESNYQISFYDCIHIAICFRLALILVTRDKSLLVFARRYIMAEKPENLI